MHAGHIPVAESALRPLAHRPSAAAIRDRVSYEEQARTGLNFHGANLEQRFPTSIQAGNPCQRIGARKTSH
jgi:hypothetical protein